MDTTESTGLSKRARVGIIVGVVVVAFVVAAVFQRRRIDDFEQTVTRVQLQAQAVGDGLDLTTFPAASAAQHLSAQNDAGPKIAGTWVSNVTASVNPPKAVIDYQIDQSGQTACVRVTRTTSGTEVTEAEVACSQFTFTGTP